MFDAKLSLTFFNGYYVFGNYRQVCGKHSLITPVLTHLYQLDAFVLIRQFPAFSSPPTDYPQQFQTSQNKINNQKNLQISSSATLNSTSLRPFFYVLSNSDGLLPYGRCTAGYHKLGSFAAPPSHTNT